MTGVGARVWPFVPAGLLVVMLAGLGSMAAIAVNDPGFALERDYYKKAVGFDAEMAQRATNARLGWTAAIAVGKASAAPSELGLTLRDAAGPVEGARVQVEALRNAGASVVFDASLVETAPGLYQARLPLQHGGLWEFRFTATRAGERFTSVLRHDVGDAP